MIQAALSPDGYQINATVVQGHTFTISNRYDLKNGKILGKGSFGIGKFGPYTTHYARYIYMCYDLDTCMRCHRRSVAGMSLDIPVRTDCCIHVCAVVRKCVLHPKLFAHVETRLMA